MSDQDQLFQDIISFQEENESLVELYEKSESYTYKLVTDLLTANFPHWRTEKGIGTDAVQFLLETLVQVENYDVEELEDESEWGVNLELKVHALTEEILDSYALQEKLYQNSRESRDKLDFEIYMLDNFEQEDDTEEVRKVEWANFERPKDEDMAVWF